MATRLSPVRILVAAAAVALLLGGYTAWWFLLSARLQAGLTRWVEQQNAGGRIAVATGTVAVGGFPGRVRMVLAEPAVTYAGDLRWEGPPLRLSVAPWAPNRPHLHAPGLHKLAWAGQPPLAVTAGGADADLLFDGQGLDSLHVDLADVAAADLKADHATVAWQRAAATPAGADSPSAPATGLSLAVEGVTLPDNPRLLFGRQVPSAVVEARLIGPLPDGPLRPALEAWRRDGGTLELDRVAIAWPPLGLTGKGTLALDRDMQPLLASTCTIEGLFEAIDGLTRAGTVRPSDAGLAKVVLGLLGKPGPSGVKQWTLPLTVQNQLLYVGPAPLLPVPPVSW